MIEVLNWTLEHPWMTILLTLCVATIVAAFGAWRNS
jgi:hypothetical protein